MTTKSASHPGMIYFLALCMTFFVLLSCTNHKKNGPDPRPSVPAEFRTELATFHPLGGVIENFNMNFDNLGDMPIREYGIVYFFKDDSTIAEPTISDKKAIFKLPAQVGKNTETVKIGYPVGTHFLYYRAYVKQEGDIVNYGNRLKASI